MKVTAFPSAISMDGVSPSIHTTHTSYDSIKSRIESCSTVSKFDVGANSGADEFKVANVKETKKRRDTESLPPNIFDAYARICSRPTFSGTLTKHGSISMVKVEDLLLDQQETLLIDDLLFVLQGIEGDHVTANLSTDGSIDFKINAAFDSALKTLAYRILPLAVAYSKVARFTDTYSGYNHGTIIQALCASLKILLEEFLTLICQFESEFNRAGPSKLSLQKLYAYTQPVLHIFEVMCEICAEVERSKPRGGYILSLLHKKSSDLVGDKAAVDLCKFLLRNSAKPYLSMLERWLYLGEIFDPHNEFMIRENVDKSKKKLTGAMFDQIDNWDHRYILKKDLCPTFLFPVSTKILNCGKYLNIIFSCGITLDNKCPKKRLHDLKDENSFLSTVNDVYDYASKSLIQLLLNQNHLIECFSSVKHYFLIDQGDWLLHFLELASGEELELDLNDARLHRLESFLDLALRSSSLKTDLLREEIRAHLKPSSLTAFLIHLSRIDTVLPGKASALKPADDKSPKGHEAKVFEAFTIKFDANWPLSIIFNKKIMLQYEIVFRRLLQCKYIERRLCCCWMSKKYRDAPLFTLMLHEMLTFIKNYLYHATAEVLEPKWHQFHEHIVSSSNSGTLNIDDALQEHSLLLDDCTKDCLLTDPQLVEYFQSILNCCSRFALIFDHEHLLHQFKVDDLKDEFDKAQVQLLDRMQFMSVSSQERLWTDIAYRLDLK